MYIFLDESGQFTKNNNEEYFIVVSFTVGEPKRTRKRFKMWQKTRFPKRMRYQSEIKWSSDISDELRLRTLKFISKLDVRIIYSFLKRKNIPDCYFNGKKIESGLLYTSVIAETLEMYLPSVELEFRAFCDQRHLKNVTQSEFKNLLKVHLLPGLPAKSIFQVEMVDSTTDANIQIADWLAGALSCYKEKKVNGEEYYRILRNNIIKQKELFEDNVSNYE